MGTNSKTPGRNAIGGRLINPSPPTAARSAKGPCRNAASGPYVIGETDWAKISAIEGVALTRGQKGEFREFSKRGLTAEERRREIAARYGKKT